MLYFVFAFSSLAEKANSYLLPCPFKYLSGYDCPGCGFQRSVLALLKGDFHHSFDLYPPTLPILVTFAVCLSAYYYWGAGSNRLIKIMVTITGTIILLNYGYKVLGPHPVTAVSRNSVDEAKDRICFVDIIGGMQQRQHQYDG